MASSARKTKEKRSFWQHHHLAQESPHLTYWMLVPSDQKGMLMSQTFNILMDHFPLATYVASIATHKFQESSLPLAVCGISEELLGSNTVIV